LDFIWLIEGHLSEESAMKMVQTAEDAFAGFKRIKQDNQPFQRCLKLRKNTVYTLRI
jgi:hypothetical protein